MQIFLLYIYYFPTKNIGVLVVFRHIGYFVVDFLRVFEAIFKKDLYPCIRGPRGSCLKKTEVKNLVAWPLYSYTLQKILLEKILVYKLKCYYWGLLISINSANISLQ
jgi:hypothetical protein